MPKSFLTVIALTTFFLISPAIAQDDIYKPPINTPQNHNSSTMAHPNQRAPDTSQTKTFAPSALEELYTRRVSTPLEQFGYDLFDQQATQTPEITTAPMGAVQDDFILGSGDQLLITFTGQRNDQKLYKIDTRGMLVMKDLPPIPAMGRSIKQVRAALSAQITSMPNTQAYVSLSSVRQIGVLVVGHVKKPGRKTLNVFHTVLDALNLAGGIQKEGSLRAIKLIRNGRGTSIDLYNLLLNGTIPSDIRLRDGDRIIIPPIGPTLAIAGDVKRPGIYEIKKARQARLNLNAANSEKLSLNAMLNLSGGVLAPNQNRFLKLSISSKSIEHVQEIKDPITPSFNENTILSVISAREKRSGTIELAGHTRKSGIHDLSSNQTLRELLQNDAALGDDIYPLIGVIQRKDKEQLSTQYISYPLRSVLKNEFDLKLQGDDIIILLSNSYISNTYNNNGFDTNNKEKHKKSSPLFSHKKINPETLKSYLKEQSIYVRGAVRAPGQYPIAAGITLDNIIAASGGMTLEANPQSIEITSSNLNGEHRKNNPSATQRTTIDLNSTNPVYVSLSPGDTVRVNQKFRKMEERTVRITGEVLHPGEYDLLAEDSVSTLIQRAGGLTKQAYAPGAIFSRESERKAEELRFRAAAHDMERRLASAIERDKNPPDATQIEMVRALADELAEIEAVGRITVETDPAILSTKPELDMLLEKGDRLFIPKRPLTVRVSGEILSPASLQFRKDKDPRDYIHQAGGFTYHADKNRTFVLFPDGSAHPLKVSTWNHTPVFIPPGSTIVVPRDPKPFDFIESAKEVGQILSNLAVTSVFIDDIRD